MIQQEKIRNVGVRKNPLRRMSVSEMFMMGLIYTILILFSLIIILPCLNILALSFNDGRDAARGGVWFWPRQFTVDNYRNVFANDEILPAYGITIARTFIGTVLTLFVTSLAAFTLREQQLPGRRAIILFITFCLVFSGGTIPTYIVYRELGLTNTFWVFIVPSLVSVTHLMMMRSSFEGIPDELFESAELDGAGYVRIYGTIVIPLSKAILAVIGLYTAVGHWNDWFAGAYYVQNPKLRPVMTVLQQMLTRATRTEQEITSVTDAIARQSNVTSQSLQMAAVVITLLPILMVYPFVQKYFTQGTLIGAVKG